MLTKNHLTFNRFAFHFVDGLRVMYPLFGLNSESPSNEIKVLICSLNSYSLFLNSVTDHAWHNIIFTLAFQNTIWIC